MKCICSLILIVCLVSAESRQDKCDRCIPVEDCSLFGQLSRDDQAVITSKFSCTAQSDDNANKPYGFSSVAKGDYVCCPDTNVWGIEPSEHTNQPDTTTHKEFSSNDEDVTYKKNNENYYPQSRPYPGRNSNYDNSPGVPQSWDNPIYRPQQYSYDTRPRYEPNTPGFSGNYPNNYDYPNSYNYPNQANNQGRQVASQNQYPNVENQCQNIGLSPPNPDTGCCGIQVLDENPRNSARQNSYNNERSYWTPQPYNPRWARNIFKRSADNDSLNNVTVEIDSRIAGGKETELEQFPWTVLLTVTFDYGDKKKAYNCGGSLISSRYVLTAGHCLSERGGRVDNIQVVLSEYDKRTTGRDCKRDADGNRKCIQNIIMQAENFVTHPQFDEDALQNDIALIRLQENAPYTDYIRPICLPPIDIDNPRYSDLRLAVAGWGRNGPYQSQIKQWTVVNLVPQRECSAAYPQITRRHLCAAGRSGEDTCKGDSGGPLMMLYESKYFVSGIVSGKRADVPCGTSGDVPSLYTNVYHYMDWIIQNIQYG